MWKLYKWKQRKTIYTHVSGNGHVCSRVKVFVPFRKKSFDDSKYEKNVTTQLLRLKKLCDIAAKKMYKYLKNLSIG